MLTAIMVLSGTFLKIAATLDHPEYVKRVVPSICKLFTSNDRSIRRSLLENIDVFGDKFDATTIEEKVHVADPVIPSDVPSKLLQMRPAAPRPQYTTKVFA